jgi:ABC-2 type transport system permease protein
MIVDPLWRFAIQADATFRGLFAWFTPFPYISNIFIAPFVQIALFAFVTRFATGREASDAVIVGMAVLSLSWIINGGILQSFTNERSGGTLPVLLASRGNRLVAYWSRGALHYLDGLLAATVTLTAAVLVFRVSLANVEFATVALALAASAMACVAFALFCGNFTMILRNWLALNAAINGSMLSLTGVVIPRTSLPEALQALGSVLPFTNGLAAMRAGLEGSSVPDVASLIGAELLVGLAYASAGSLLYRWIEFRARVSGDFHE